MITSGMMLTIKIETCFATLIRNQNVIIGELEGEDRMGPYKSALIAAPLTATAAPQ